MALVHRQGFGIAAMVLGATRCAGVAGFGNLPQDIVLGCQPLCPVGTEAHPGDLSATNLNRTHGMPPLYAVRSDARDNGVVGATCPTLVCRARASLHYVDAYLPGTVDPAVDDHPRTVGRPIEAERQGVCPRRQRGRKRYIGT